MAKVDRLKETQGCDPSDPLLIVIPVGPKRPRTDALIGVTTPTVSFRLGMFPKSLPDLEKLTNDTTSRFVHLEKEVLEGSGIGRLVTITPSVLGLTDMVLYIRDRCREQIKFIQEHVEFGGDVALIIGQQGTGKSVTAYMTALAMASKPCGGPIILWIHINQSKETKIEYDCVLIHHGQRQFTRICDEEILKSFLIENWGIDDSHSTRVLFIDGYVKVARFQSLADKALEWMERSRISNRLIFLSSMGSSRLLTSEAEISIAQTDFIQYSWTSQEYEDALKNDTFRKNVFRQLANDDDDADPFARAEINMRTKFYYAGGCARFMFQFRTGYVKKILDRRIRASADVSQLTNALRGNCSPTLTHSLLSVFSESNRDLVSQYVKHSVAMMTDLVPLLNFAREFRGNASMCGWLFEEFFFKKLWTAGSVNLQGEPGEPTFTFKRGTRMWYIFNPENIVDTECPFNEWLRPSKYNQGGFDAVYIQPSGKSTVDVIFIQCTIAKSHDAKLNYCCDFLKQMEKNLNLKTANVTYHFVLPNVNLALFKVSSVIGSLKEYTSHPLLIYSIDGWINEQ